jgi:single-strand DNA-binding protein
MLNRVILIGRLATDPELKFTPSGIAVTTFRIAVDRPLSAEARAQGQEKQADFIDIVSWRQNAEFAANYLSKGRLVAVEGKLQIREYVTQDGQRRRNAEVVADNFKPLDRPREQTGEGGGDEARGGYAETHTEPRAAGGNDRAGGGRGAPASSPAGGRGAGARSSAGDSFDEELSDLSDPFAE